MGALGSLLLALPVGVGIEAAAAAAESKLDLVVDVIDLEAPVFAAFLRREKVIDPPGWPDIAAAD
jgi:hypothetical protein